MNLKDQVLSIEQVRELQELQELGFDVNKHSSLKSNGKQIIVQDDFYIGGAPLFPTMTIGDIIEVLPQRITMNNTGYILKTLHKFDISYTDCAGRKLNAFNLSLETLNLINALFETLKWCIKEKHIAL